MNWLELAFISLWEAFNRSSNNFTIISLLTEKLVFWWCNGLIRKEIKWKKKTTAHKIFFMANSSTAFHVKDECWVNLQGRLSGCFVYLPLLVIFSRKYKHSRISRETRFDDSLCWTLASRHERITQQFCDVDKNRTPHETAWRVKRYLPFVRGISICSKQSDSSFTRVNL